MERNVMFFEEFCTENEIIDDEKIRHIAYFSYLCGLRQAGIDVDEFYIKSLWAKTNAQKNIKIENHWKEKNRCGNLKDANIAELSNKIKNLANSITEYCKMEEKDFKENGEVLLVHGIVD